MLNRLLISLLLCASAAFSQTSNTALLGTITDSSGAGIPNAQVTITHQPTQTVWTAVTNEQGGYFASVTQVGAYTVAAERAGFQSVRKTGIEVMVNDHVRVDFTMDIGSITDTVTVEGHAAAISTDEASLGEVLSQKHIEELPLNGRDVLQLATTSASVVMGYRAKSSSPGGGEALIGAGARENMNAISLDGASIVNNLVNTSTMRPPLEAIEEFKVQQGNYSAEYGMYLGVHVDLVTKAGTNQLHGSTFEFIRNNAVDARGFFEAPGSPQNPIRRNEFGGMLSGPVYLPKLYDGRNRTFFMADYEGQRYTQKGAQLDSVLGPLMRQGNFSELGTVIRDPMNNNQPFQGNIIPSSRIPVQALNLLKWMPSANLAGTSANYLATTLSSNDNNRAFSRLDENFSTKAHVFMRYAWQNAVRLTTGTDPFGGKHEKIPDRNLSVNYTQTISATAVNEFRFSQQKTHIDTLNLFQGNLALAGSNLGIAGLVTSPQDPGLPRIVASGFMPIGDQGDGTQWFQRDGTLQIGDALSLNRGAHNFKVGFETRFLATSRASNNDPRGNLQFTGEMSGFSAADLLLGLPRSAISPSPSPWIDMRQWRYGAYFLDDWKASSKLTLNLGVRYDLSAVPYEMNGKAPILDPTGTKIIPDPFPGRIPLVKSNPHDFAPRVGLAYRPFGGSKTVFRGGFGIYHNSNQLNNFTLLAGNPPVRFIQTFNSSPSAPSVFLANPFAGTPGVAGVPNITTPNWDLPSAYMEQWSFNIERELATGLGIEVGYLGSHTLKLDRNFQMNQPRPGPGSIQARRPNQLWGAIRLISNDSFANYNALQVVLRKRLSKGLTFLVSYTWSHAIDTTAEANGGGTNTDPFNLGLDRGNSNWDFRHRFVASYLYDLPFFQTSSSMFMRRVLGGWQLNGITTLQSGQPFSVLIAGDTANNGLPAPQRANVLSVGTLSSDQRTLSRFFNTTAYAVPAQYTFGDSAKNCLFGPGLVNFDMSLFKTIKIREKAQVQVRFEAFNIFNTPNFGTPGNVVGSPSFGQVLSTVHDNRDLQLGLRLRF
jgi:hypothetical protein